MTSPSGSGAASAASASDRPATVGADPVHEPAAGQLPDERRRTAGLVEVDGGVLPAGREARDHRRLLAGGRELVERKRDAGLARDCEQVQHAVRRPAGRRDARHRVQERAAVEEAPGGDPLRGEPERRLRRPLRCGPLRLQIVSRS